MRLTTIEVLESRLGRNYPLQEELNRSHITEWVREALRMIDNYYAFERKSLVVNIKNYTTPMPDDYHSQDLKMNQGKYREQGTSLFFRMKEGKTTIHYLAMPLDDELKPLIPDTEEYKAALTHYCAAYMCQNETIKSGESINYDKEWDKWLWKKREARADTHLAQVGVIEKVANNFHSLSAGLFRYPGNTRN
jgi:hypothetical protein